MIPIQKIGDSRIDYDHGHARLVVDGITWMEDSPEERGQRQFALDKCEGCVLVCGLGLGCIVEELAEKTEVKKIIVVEISAAVKELVWQYLKLQGKCDIIIDNIEDYLQTTIEKFDYIYLDCFTGDEHELAKRLRVLAEKLVKPDRVLIWQEEEMRKQWQK